VRFVKFTPEEMAIDAGDVDASKAPVIVRGLEEWKRFLSFKRGYVRLDPDLKKKFRNDSTVNDALRSWLEIQDASKRKKRKSA
jgi:hypothetical protein